MALENTTTGAQYVEIKNSSGVTAAAESASGYGAGVNKTAILRSQMAATNVTVANGETTSGEFDARGYGSFGLVVPSTFDGTAISFTVASATAGTYQALYDIGNNQVTMTVAASRSYDLPAELMAWPFWKIVCGTAQGGAGTIFVVVAKG